jgi:hypothetical protein
MSSTKLLLVICIVYCAAAIETVEVRGRAQSTVRQPAIKVTLLGTASGPPVRAGQAGISTLIEANGEGPLRRRIRIHGTSAGRIDTV